MKRVCTFFFMCSLFLLASCSNQSPITEVVTQNPEVIQNSPHNPTEDDLTESPSEQPTTPEEESITEQPSKIIHLIDPNTNNIVFSISPEELNYFTDYASYRNQIEELAKELARGSDSRVGYDQRMVLDKVNGNGELKLGKPMVILKESELIDRILAISPVGGDVKLPLYITETGYDRANFSSLDDVIIASYTTYFDSSVTGRTHNIKQSSNAISNVIVGVGDTFSFNTTVGPRTKETGYQEALEIVNGEFVLGIGGGICQTSSTLFNAVDQIGVFYVERHHHSKDIGYVPKGRDATVSYGTLDFRFQNTTDIPFMIISKTAEGSITVEIRTSNEYANELHQ